MFYSITSDFIYLLVKLKNKYQINKFLSFLTNFRIENIRERNKMLAVFEGEPKLYSISRN